MSNEVTPFTAYDFGTVNANTTASFPFVVPTTAEFGWCAIGWEFNASSALAALGIIAQPFVTNADEVTIYLTNPTGSNIAVGPLSGVIRVTMEGG